MNARTAMLLACLAATTACDLDIDSKPDCVSDYDCDQYYNGAQYCVVGICQNADEPKPGLDVFYIQGTPSAATPITVTGSVLANDVQADGLPLSIHSVSADASEATIVKLGSDSVSLTVFSVPAEAFYTVSNGIAPAVEASIEITALPTAVTVPVPTHGATDLAAVLQVDPAIVALAVPPMHGVVVGGGPGAYTPDATFVGEDQATFVVHAEDGDFQVVFTFDVALPVADVTATGDFSAPTNIDVLATDESGIVLVSTSSPYAQILDDHRLVVTPPYNAAMTYDIPFVAGDGAGHQGGATLHFTVEFPTEILVGSAISGDAFDPVLSTDGSTLAFVSTDATLAPNDTNGTSDVFVEDLGTGAIERVSVGSGSAQANGASGSPSISSDGRYVAFVSEATDLDARDQSSIDDIFLRDRQTGATTLVSVSTDNAGATQPATGPQVSADGSRVVFASASSTLVANDTNEVQDVFVRDLAAATTVRMSTDPAGSQPVVASSGSPRISGDGKFVALATQEGLYVVGVDVSSVAQVSAAFGTVFDLDATGRHLAFDNTFTRLYDRLAADFTTMTTFSGDSFSLTPDGTHAVFVASNPTRIMAWSANTLAINAMVDRHGNAVTATPLRRPVVSGDGKWIVFATAEWPGKLGQIVIVRLWNPTYSPS